MSKIEVESRAALSLGERIGMLAYMHSLGPVQTIIRAAVDFSGQDRTSTIVVRANNGVSEFVEKPGSLTAAVREETKKEFPPDVSFDEALRYAAERGHTQGIVMVRNMFVVQTPQFEYSLRDVLSAESAQAGALFELEASEEYVNEVGPDMALQHADERLRNYGLIPFDDASWMAWVTKIHNEVDRPFTYTPESAAALTATLTENNFLPPQALEQR